MPAASDNQRSLRQSASWLVATLPLAPLAAVAFLFSEWLFVITRPSPTSELPLGEQVLVLLRVSGPAVAMLTPVQAVASLLSLVRYPRSRGFALVPAACIGGILLLTLLDNFTLTLFGFGSVRSGEAARVAYAALLPVLVLLAGARLHTWLPASTSPRRLYAAIATTVILVVVPFIAREERLPDQPDPSVLPALQKTGTTVDRQNILFLGVDGVESAITSAYGYERPTTPFLDSLKEDTLLFENAFSNVARTHGSLVTLLTGRLPFSTHVTFPPTLLHGADGDRTLPKLLKSLGYTTLQLGMRHYADAEDTNVRGFDAANYRWQRIADIGEGDASQDDAAVFRSAVAERVDERLQRLFGAAPIVDAFAHVEGRIVTPQWRDERRVATLVEYVRQAPQPWFVHLHMLDTHCCSWHPERMHFSDGGSVSVNARDSEVREADEKIRRLFQALEASGQLERTVVVISSDHGSGWKITERVPLMIRFPNRQFTGRVSANVQLADVAPTMLAYLGVAVPDWMDGRPLVPAGSIPSDRPIFGISDIQARSGRSGERLLVDGGAHNYGAAAVMMVAGAQVFEMDLASGEMTSRGLAGSPQKAGALSDADARRLLADRLHAAGMTIDQPAQHAAVDTRPSK